MIHLGLCARTVCVRPATHTHTQSLRGYCGPCARRINEANPGLVRPQERARERKSLAPESKEKS